MSTKKFKCKGCELHFPGIVKRRDDAKYWHMRCWKKRDLHILEGIADVVLIAEAKSSIALDGETQIRSTKGGSATILSEEQGEIQSLPESLPPNSKIQSLPESLLPQAPREDTSEDEKEGEIDDT